MVCTNRWSDIEAKKFISRYKLRGFNKDLALRTYSARLLGSEPELVLHGGGNTSVKTIYKDLFGKDIKVLCVKGSGWDLGTIEPEGHPAVELEPLLKLKKLSSLNDEDMVAIQRKNLINPKSPNPSVETLLHAFLPYKFIDHTHSVALLSLANQPNAKEICLETFGNEMVIVPYVMPGFDLAKLAYKIYEQSRLKVISNNETLKGMILLKHGVFTFGEDAKQSYSRMIEVVNKAEKIIPRYLNLDLISSKNLDYGNYNNYKIIPYLRGLISGKLSKGGFFKRCIFEIRNNKAIEEFSKLNNLLELSKRGVATPDHVIRTKSRPLILESLPNIEFDLNSSEGAIQEWLENTKKSLESYIENYQLYFESNNKRVGKIKKNLDPLPRLIIIPNFGMIALGDTKNSACIAADIGQVWIETILSAESLGQFRPVGESDIFDLEYWSLEQAKLGTKKIPSNSGKVVIVTGAGGTIGSEISKVFSRSGAEVVCIDKNLITAKETANQCGKNALAIECDLTSRKEIKKAFKEIILRFGGVDILISNAGIALPGELHNLEDDIFSQSLNINLLSHHYLSQESLKIFKSQDFFNISTKDLLGGQLLYNISKQALNPGKGFGAYGISKTALLALMKQYALEEGKNKVRSNCVNADRIKSGLLNKEMIQKRSKVRGLTEEEYMTGNLLNSEVMANDVAKAFLSLSSMEKTTGLILTVDGGNVAAMPR
tara:strand:+ start:522 stop:2666 length:2145 start_codon:yes stop_codon:yes gene_type:complete